MSVTQSGPWLRASAVALALFLSLLTTGCGLAAAALIDAIADGGDDDDGGGGGGGGPTDPRPTVGVIHALPGTDHVADVVDRLTSTESFESVTAFDASVATPTLAELHVFDAVLVVADGSFLDAAALGDVLATYSNAGGGVVTATHARSGNGILGAWTTGTYGTIDLAGVVSGDGPIGWVAALPLQPIIAGLTLPGGGTGSDRPDIATVSAGSTLVASWSTGEPLVAVGVTSGSTRVVSLGFHVVTSAVDPSFVAATSDAPTIVARALLWVALEI